MTPAAEISVLLIRAETMTSYASAHDIVQEIKVTRDLLLEQEKKVRKALRVLNEYHRIGTF